MTTPEICRQAMVRKVCRNRSGMILFFTKIRFPGLVLVVLVKLTTVTGTTPAPSDCGPGVVGLASRPGAAPCRLRLNAHQRQRLLHLLQNSSDVAATLNEATEKGRRSAEEAVNREESIVKVGGVAVVLRESPEYHQYLMESATPQDTLGAREALVDQCNASAIARTFAEKLNIPLNASGDVLAALQLPVDVARCHATRRHCNADTRRYRTLDGSCNNEAHPGWGAAGTPFTRLTAAVFEDGVNEPRRSVSGDALPSARVVRTSLLPDADVDDDGIYTLLTVHTAQLLVHDTALSGNQVGLDGRGVMCCSQEGSFLPPNLTSQACLPVYIPKDDAVWAPLHKSCMSVVRSVKTFTSGCILGPAQMVNAVNHWVDLSVVYGVSRFDSDALRSMEGGRLAVGGQRGFPDNARRASVACGADDDVATCFAVGDIRGNQSPGLAALQVLMFRRHNDVAAVLEQVNPQWSDERLFQEARRILVAQWQHVVYQELLPVLVGTSMARDYRLTPAAWGYASGYDGELNPSTTADFTSGVFRVLHSAVPGRLRLLDETRCPLRTLRISDWFDRPEVVPGNLDPILRGLATQGQRNGKDRSSAVEVSEELFRHRDGGMGQDLGAFDIQRNRDAGLPPYNSYREMAGLPRARTFEDLLDTHDANAVAMLRRLYRDPDDVDVTAGAVLERPLQGSFFGPVAIVTVVEQFYRWKFGDRHFYEFQRDEGFTLDQLKELKKTSMARLLCDGGNNILQMQANAFRMISNQNPLKNCDDIPTVSLLPWKELTQSQLSKT